MTAAVLGEVLALLLADLQVALVAQLQEPPPRARRVPLSAPQCAREMHVK